MDEFSKFAYYRFLKRIMFTMELQGHVPVQEFGKFSFKMSDLMLFGSHRHSSFSALRLLQQEKNLQFSGVLIT